MKNKILLSLIIFSLVVLAGSAFGQIKSQKNISVTSPAISIPMEAIKSTETGKAIEIEIQKTPEATIIALPRAVSVKISPKQAEPILIDEKPVEFKGLEAAPALSLEVKTKLISTAPTTASVKIDIDEERKLTKIEVVDTVAITQEILKFEESTLKVETPKRDISLAILPDMVSQIVIANEQQKVEKIELKMVNQEPLYEVNGEKEEKIFWLIPAKIPITTQLSVETGEITKIKKPWWGYILDFIAF